MFEIGKLTKLPLGMQGENKARTIQINMKDWLEDWPGAAIVLTVKRPGDSNFYPADIDLEGNVLSWTLTRADVANAGEGEAQLVLKNGDDVELRSRVVRTVVEESLSGTLTDAPMPQENWITSVLATGETSKANAKAAADSASEAKASAEAAAKSAEEASQNGSGVDTEARKQIAALSAEMVKTINGVEPDENGNVQIEVEGGGGGGGVSIDTTLTQSGKAADAKVTGDGLKACVKTVNGTAPDANGNVSIATGGGGGGSDVAIDTTMTVSGAAADAASVGQRFNLMSLQLGNKAPVNHASPTDEYGVATADTFGHVKAAWLDKILHMGHEEDGQNPALWYTTDGTEIGDNVAAQEYLAGIVPNMFMMSQWNHAIGLTLQDTENQLAVQEELLKKKADATHADQHGKDSNDPITPEMIGAAPAGNYVKSINGSTPDANGNVTIQREAETDPTVPAWAKQPIKPSYSKGEVGLGNVDNVKQYSESNPPPYPVTSVNGKTGEVSITTDTTLKVAGESADAKAVGDAIAETNGVVNQKFFEVLQSRAPKVHAENHGFTDTLTWDGVIGDRVTVTEESVDFSGIVYTYVRVWDKIVPFDNGFTADTTVSNIGMEHFYSLGYEHLQINEQISVVVEEYGNEGAGSCASFPTRWCISSDNTEWGSLVFPKAGVYFTTATSERGVVYQTKSLTVHNYDFGDAADPIAPEMISAAPEHHAVASEKHGVATNKLFGHTRLHGIYELPRQGIEENGQDPSMYYTFEGDLIGNDEDVYKYTKGAAVSAGFFFIFNQLLNSSFEDVDYLWDTVDELYRRVIALENKVNALGG